MRDRGLKVSRISSGQIFRDLASSENKSIEAFIQELTRNPEKARQVDVLVDNEIKRRIEEAIRGGIVPVVDSNLAPFYARGIKILVKTDPEIAGKRVYKNKRKSDTSFKNPEEARADLEERTKRDIERYKKLSGDPSVPMMWRGVYGRAVKEWGDEDLFDIVVDNSGSVEDSMNQIIDGLVRILILNSE